jgi:transglutaminase-like putative cysteine protease
MLDRDTQELRASGEPTPDDLRPTVFIDTEHDTIRQFVDRVVGDATGEPEVAAHIFAAVRDEIRYDPYAISKDPDDYRASVVLDAGRGYCVQKSVLLTAAARSAGIPSRLGFADVRNHLQSARLLEVMGTDLFVYHGYSTLFVAGHWTKASPAFNAELCARFGVPPLDYDGTHDALLHAYTGDGTRHMEYIHDHGIFADLPFETVMSAYREAYPNFISA